MGGLFRAGQEHLVEKVLVSEKAATREVVLALTALPARTEFTLGLV